MALADGTGKRVALVIGNGAYTHASALANPINDARGVAAALTRIGFSGIAPRQNDFTTDFKTPGVTALADLEYNALRRALAAFGRAAEHAGQAILYYAGHGIEVGGLNYLIPVDAQLAHPKDVEFETASLTQVLGAVDGAHGLRLVILDACRDNPFRARLFPTRDVSRGLRAIEPSGNILVAYAAKHGTVALDGKGANSPFAASLLTHIETPGLEIVDMFREVKDDVLEATGRSQEPYLYGSMGRRREYLVAAEAVPVEAVPLVPAEPAPFDPRQMEHSYWEDIKNAPDSELVEEFLARFPDGVYAALAARKLEALRAEARAKAEACLVAGAESLPGNEAYPHLPAHYEADTASLAWPPSEEQVHAKLGASLKWRTVAGVTALAVALAVGGFALWPQFDEDTTAAHAPANDPARPTPAESAARITAARGSAIAKMQAERQRLRIEDNNAFEAAKSESTRAALETYLSKYRLRADDARALIARLDTDEKAAAQAKVETQRREMEVRAAAEAERERIEAAAAAKAAEEAEQQKAEAEAAEAAKRAEAALLECDRLTASPADAERKGDGVPFEQLDHARAIPVCKQAVESNPGNTRLVYLLGRASHRAGAYGSAYAQYLDAANNNYTPAMTELGVILQNGLGQPQDYTKAREWFEKAANNDDATAMAALGTFYEKKLGVKQDYAKARKWYEKAAAKDNAEAMLALGTIYSEGSGVEVSETKARQWWEKAAAKDSAEAMKDLGELYANGWGVDENYTKAREWYEKAAAKGNVDAMVSLGDIYENGNGVEMNETEAAKWWEAAGDKGHVDSMIKLGKFYSTAGSSILSLFSACADGNNRYDRSNRDERCDFVKARKWYEKAAAKNSTEAMVALGGFYYRGDGVEQNTAKARKWYEKAAAKDDTSAMRELGVTYEEGRPSDYSKAVEWYTKAAEGYDRESMMKLGLMYARGRGVTKSYVKAREWWDSSRMSEAEKYTKILDVYGTDITVDFDTMLEKWDALSEAKREKLLQEDTSSSKPLISLPGIFGE